jgi:hypothetical protein
MRLAANDDRDSSRPVLRGLRCQSVARGEQRCEIGERSARNQRTFRCSRVGEQLLESRHQVAVNSGRNRRHLPDGEALIHRCHRRFHQRRGRNGRGDLLSAISRVRQRQTRFTDLSH